MGKPRVWKSPEDMQQAIDAYFAACDGTPLLDTDGNPMFDKLGRPVMAGQKPYTITGLALALNFTGRQALLDYQGRGEYADTVTRAKARCEQYAESRLFDRDGAMGAKFSLVNNYRNWHDRQEHDLSGFAPVTIVNNVPEGEDD